VSPAWPGNRNDIVVARAHHHLLLADPPRRVLADGAYRSLPHVITPRPRQDRPDHPRQDVARSHTRRRATIEHVIATAVLHDSPELPLYVPRDSVGPGGLIDRPDLRDGLARALATFAGQLR
jgi:hypothetical protein